MRGLNSGADFDPKFLEEIYDDIKINPFEFNFSKTAPGIEINSVFLKYDSTFKKLESLIVSNGVDISKVFNIKDRELTAKVDKPMPFLALLTGYEGVVTITDSINKSVATIQIYQPSIISRLLFSEQSRMVIQPSSGSTDGSLKLAGQLAAAFNTPVSSIKATYDYEKEDINNALVDAKKVVTKGAGVSF